ncbi:MAG: SAM-dependent methyltransferase [Candidatus Acidiferrales bacterium]
MKRALSLLAVAALTAAPFAALGRAQDKQSLAEIAAEAKRKKQESTRPVLTNEEMPAAGLPSIKLLRQSSDPPSLAPYEATPLPAVEALLEVAGVGKDEVVFDIGSGDGRIVIAAAEHFGAFGVGIEIDSDLVARSRKTIEEKGLTERVRIIHANALDVDLSAADVVTLYIAPEGMRLLRPHLEATLRPGTRVVSRRSEMEGWTPAHIERREGDAIYLYRVP